MTQAPSQAKPPAETLAETPALSAAELQRLLREAFPQVFEGDGAFVIEAVAPMRARVRLPYHERHLRPGGTMSGPSMFALADCAIYLAILATIGWVPLAVTTNLNINFMNKPGQKDLVADCTLLKLGKTLAVGDVLLRSDGSDVIVAQATGTYSIPKQTA
jgi:uncharacterized protein (TIGR00369 family)